MNFGEAIEALKQGRKAQRSGWNGKGMFIYLVPGQTVDYSNLRSSAKQAADLRTIYENGVNGSSRYINSHIDMINVDGQIVVGWLASQTDMLSEDWVFVD